MLINYSAIQDGANVEANTELPMQGTSPDSEGISGASDNTPNPPTAGSDSPAATEVKQTVNAAVQQAAAQGITLSPDQLRDIIGQAVRESTGQVMQQFAPKPPQAPKIYSDSKWLTGDQQHFTNGLGQFVEDRFEEKYGNDLRQLIGIVNQLQQTMPAIYAYAQPNPQFNTVQTRANELVNKYGVSPQQALRMASDEISRNPPKPPAARPAVPGHASTPDNRGNAQVPDEDSGKPAEFGAIMRDLRKAGHKI